jgi:hypothetical protein
MGTDHPGGKDLGATPGRDDLGSMKTLGVSFLHLYDWSRQGNEYDLGSQSQNAKKVASIIQKTVAAETELNISEDQKLAITAPASTATKPTWYSGDAEEECKIALRELKKELEAINLGDVWKNRFVVSINPFQNADGLATRIKTQYPAMLKGINDGKDMYFCFF